MYERKRSAIFLTLPTKQNGELKVSYPPTSIHVGTQMDGAQIGRTVKQNAKRILPYHEYFGQRGVEWQKLDYVATFTQRH